MLRTDHASGMVKESGGAEGHGCRVMGEHLAVVADGDGVELGGARARQRWPPLEVESQRREFSGASSTVVDAVDLAADESVAHDELQVHAGP